MGTLHRLDARHLKVYGNLKSIMLQNKRYVTASFLSTTVLPFRCKIMKYWTIDLLLVSRAMNLLNKVITCEINILIKYYSVMN